MKASVVIGSRGSKLALIQARIIQTSLLGLEPSLDVRIEIIKTSGDIKSDPLSVIGGKGVFTKELEDALVDRRINIAVHSLKDLPTIIPDGLRISAITQREDARDALVLPLSSNYSTIERLPRGSNVGTSSPRRLAQLKHLRPDLVFSDLRGNVDTRLQKLDEGQYDALILACAGLRRLGMNERISQALHVEKILPAVGQGALAVQVRDDDQQSVELTHQLDDEPTRLACMAERALLRRLGGGCQLPIAAHAVVSGSNLTLHGLVAETEGKEIIRSEISGASREAEKLGDTLAEQLLERGANRLLNL